MAISQKAIKKAIIDYKGNVSRVAESFGVSGGAIRNRIAKSATLKKTLQESRDSRNDRVVDVLYNAADGGNVTAAIYITKAQMGWKETAVIEHKELIINVKHDS